MITPARVLAAEKYYPLSFDGTNNYVDCGNDESLNITDTITVEARIKINNNNITQTVISKWSDQIINKAYIMLLTGVDINFYIGDGTTYTNATFRNILSVGNWFHIIGTYDKATIKIFVNNIKGEDKNFTSNIATSSSHLGVGERIPENTQPLDGIIDKASIYNRVLSPEERKQLYYHKPILNGLVLWMSPQRKYEGTLWDRSGKENNGTIYGATPSTEECNARPLRIVA